MVLRIMFLLTLASLIPRVGSADWTVGRNVPAQQRVAVTSIRHDDWDELLRKYVDPQGQVNYGALQNNPADLARLDRYLDQLSTADLDRPSSQDPAVHRYALLAFWINAYNAVTVKGILREYPTSSIRNHTARLVGYNIWHDLLLRVDGQQVSLDDIEHKKLRPMGEPRIHFAIVCASVGCPRLLNQAYRADRLEEQLTVNAKHFFGDPSKFRFDSSTNTAIINPILQWFQKDFGANNGAMLQRVAPWVPTPVAQQWTARGLPSRVRYSDYDWSLNDQR